MIQRYESPLLPLRTFKSIPVFFKWADLLSQRKTYIVNLLLILLMSTWGLTAQEVPEVSPETVRMASKHVVDSVPKGLAALKDPTLTFLLEGGITISKFSIQLECDEPRYLITEITPAGGALSKDEVDRLKIAGVETRYLRKKHETGDRLVLTGSFTIRANGSGGAIKDFLSPSVGILRGAEPNLPLEGEPKYLSAKSAIEDKFKVQTAASQRELQTSVVSILDTINQIQNRGKNTDTIKAAEVLSNVFINGSNPADVIKIMGSKTNVTSLQKGPNNTSSSSTLSTEEYWLTLDQAATVLGKTQAEVLQLIVKGQLKANQTAGGFQVSSKDLAKLMGAPKSGASGQ